MKYFVVSDIHSYYNELINALNEKGFNKKTDTLVVAGDMFDRGPDTIKVYKFLKKLKRKYIICGNHEDLYLNLLDKNYPDVYDYTNGTVETFKQISGENEWEKMKIKVSKHPITKFIKELKYTVVQIDDYIICHSTPDDFWANPYIQKTVPGKTIIFGHRTTRNALNYSFGEVRDGIFYGDGLIGIDAGWEGRKKNMKVFVIETED